MSRLLTKIVLSLLKGTRLTLEDKTKITSALLDKSQALHIKDVLKIDEQNRVHVNGRVLELEQTQILLDSVKALKDNFARKVIHDQINYEAIKMGVHQGLTTDMIMFSKAAIWLQQQEDRLLNELINE